MLDSIAGRLRDAASRGSLALAYSGGLDSRFLAHVALRVGVAMRAFHIAGPHVPGRESEYALRWAESVGMPVSVVRFDPFALPQLRNNPHDRCYHCKKAMFSVLRDAADGAFLCDGSNLSDEGEYRPGLRALQEMGVVSPLAESGVAKNDIRRLGVETGLENPAQTAQPCLFTRFAYGAAVNAQQLQAVSAVEDAVLEVFTRRSAAAPAFRFRYETPQTPALHVALDSLSGDVAEEITTALAGAGFSDVPIRCVDNLSGYFDR